MHRGLNEETDDRVPAESTGEPSPSPALQARIGRARAHLAAGDLPSAVRAAREVLAAGPDLADGHHLLALACFAEGRYDAALEHGRAAIIRAPRRADLRFTLGRIDKAGGRVDEAIAHYREALRLDPQGAAVEVSLGIALKSTGDLDGAIACYRRALVLEPGLAVAHTNLGNALVERSRRIAGGASLDDLSSTLSAHRRAADLDPGNPRLLHNLGASLMERGELEAAIEAFNRSLGADPSRRDTCIQMASCMRRLGKPDGARACYARWLEMNAESADMLANLAASLLELGEVEAAIDVSRRALALDARSPEALHNLASALQQHQDLDGAVTEYCRSIAARPDYLEARAGLALTLNYLEEDPDTLRRAHLSYGACLEPLPARPAVVRPATGRPLRVGYVSGDFRRHSVAYFFEPLLSAHDRRRFSVHCYSCHDVQDDVASRIRAQADGWLDCAGMPPDVLAERIRRDRIDVLIDLSGHTGESRLTVFARRPAPLQLAYLGYPTGTGLAAIDYRISDPAIDPAGEDRPGGEAVLRLPRSMFCYGPDADTDVGDPPSLRTGRITFGSFNNLAKVGDASLRLWSAVLDAVPDARLLLKTRALSQPANRDQLARRLGALGIAGDRLVLNPWRPDLQSHLEVYREIDVALDTYPYNGATTTCEALWMGVPVVTRRGATHASRMGASLLGAAGLTDWIVPSATAFVDRAVELASDRGGLQAFRHDARRRLRASPLMDAAAFARDFESTIERAWQQVAREP